jgi:hypothetical protein
MPKRVFRVRAGEPLLDIVSYGRGGPRENGGRLAPHQIEQIRRTVQRVPEVMVKVLPRASSDLKAAGKHLDYISRDGRLVLEADDGDRLEGQDGRAVLEEWDVDIDDVRRQANLASTRGRRPPTLVHKLMFSMPAGTPPDKVLAAVRNFAREEFWGQHRNAFVLHTDEDHPHVHLVLKAVSEWGVRLNIKKATLRHWRSEFARHLRELGVPANATDRAVRGQNRKAKKDGIYRASQRGDSMHVRAQAEAIGSELLQGRVRVERGKSQLVETRHKIEHGWRTAIGLLRNQGHSELAAFVARFVDEMPPPATEKELVARALVEHVHVPALRRAPPVRSLAEAKT